MSLEFLSKVPFQANGSNLEVWLFRDQVVGEFRAEVRQDAAQVAFVWPDGSKAKTSYTVSFETEFDAQVVSGMSAVSRIVEAAKDDAFTMKFEKVKQNG